MKQSLKLWVFALILAACQFMPGGNLNAPVAATITPLPLSPETLPVVARLPGRIDSFAVKRDSNMIAFATTKGIILYDLEAGKRLRTLDEGSYGFSLAWSPDGSKLAAGVSTGESDEYEGLASLRVWDTSNWEILFDQPIREHERILDVAWSPDGNLLAMSADLIGVMVWDIQTGELLSHQTEFASSVQSVSWSPDGERLVASSDLAYGIRRWRIADDESVRLFDKRAGASTTVAWSPDGKRIASTHSNGGLCIWLASNNRCEMFIKAHISAAFSLAWSPDGGRVASGGGAIRVWDALNGQQILAFGEDDRFSITRLEWHAPSRALVSLQVGMETPETRVRFWDAANGVMLLEFEGGG